MKATLDFRDDLIDKEVAEKLSKEVTSYIIEQVKNNMKTIEEKAKEYAPSPFDPDEIIYTKKGYVVNVIRDAYTVGANAQKAIDIEKACEWLDNYLMEIGYPDDWLRDSLNIKSGKERFRKAMEE